MGAHLSSAEHDTISFGLRVGNVNPALAMLPQSHQPQSTSDTRSHRPDCFAEIWINEKPLSSDS